MNQSKFGYWGAPGFALAGLAAFAAAPMARADFVVAGFNTLNSVLRISGRPSNPNADKIRVDITKMGANFGTGRNYYPYSGGPVDFAAFLSFGAGTYQVNVMSCQATDQNSENCTGPTSDMFQVTNSDTQFHQFQLPSGNMESDAQSVIDQALAITAGYSTDREKSLAIHDWVATNIIFDLAAVKAKNDVKSPLDAVTVLRERLGVCEGIAYLMGALHRAIGIPAKVIDGAAGSAGEVLDSSSPDDHAWNEIWIDNRWVVEDATWDGGYESNSTHEMVQKLSHDFFDPLPAFFAKTHLKFNEKAE